MYKLFYSHVLLLFFIHLSSQAQTPEKRWDKTFGGNNIDQLHTLVATRDEGFLLGGISNSIISGDKTQDRRGSFDYWIVKTDSTGNKIWDRRYGGTGSDVLYAALQTQDEGYLLLGYSSSGKGGDKSGDNIGEEDFWVVKIDSQGNLLWEKTYGGEGGDILRSAIETPDGGYLLAGNSFSDISGDKSENSLGQEDYWVVSIDKNGNKLWDKRYGGNEADFLSNIIYAPDGGFLLVGTSFSGIGADKSQPSQGSWDYWLVKIDETGNKLWDKTYGGIHSEFPGSVISTSEGNYLISGISDSGSGGDKSQESWGGWDYWVLKLDKSGNKLWDKRYGGAGNDDFGWATETLEGNYLLAGSSTSDRSGDKTQDSEGESDYWIIKIDKDGHILWDKDLGGNGQDVLKTVAQTSKGEYLLAGYSNSGSSGDKTQDSKGSFDFWLVKTVADGIFSPVLQVNFQNKNTRIPQGWEKDYGLPFGEKSASPGEKKYTYGWKNRSTGTPIDLSIGGPFPGNGRLRPAPEDILLATLMHMQGNDVPNFRGIPIESYWELAVENGHYQVSVSVGDGTNYTGTDPEVHSIRVEGKRAISSFVPQGKSGSLTRFKQATLTVEVTDGLLTIDADGGKNTKINYARIVHFTPSVQPAQQLVSQTASLHVFPNPFSDKISIQWLPTGKGKTTVSLQDALGNIYFHTQTSTPSSEYTIELAGRILKTGIYFIIITSEEGTRQVTKVLKQ
ncbi:T9SS type A sorting domain-containing protein [Rhodocytophaga rosea]|uniref:T9SS type A sorting domain-containing protein n=1 Tax=Rhodocytophaga rosea TaxID=2704465 RepID=A0A6C0GQI2_9BACT|nr:T9SS type A sorting domain-containing protein [Rhodocytophaga rosea]QHT70335.1 T9SS type A sorting domain-containing protein [Rhodocytophaga rosea]